jgi:hypothetical protein
MTGIAGLGCRTDVETQDISGIPVAAHLAPDETDVEATLTEKMIMEPRSRKN